MKHLIIFIFILTVYSAFGSQKDKDTVKTSTGDTSAAAVLKLEDLASKKWAGSFPCTISTDTASGVYTYYLSFEFDSTAAKGKFSGKPVQRVSWHWKINGKFIGGNDNGAVFPYRVEKGRVVARNHKNPEYTWTFDYKDGILEMIEEDAEWVRNEFREQAKKRGHKGVWKTPDNFNLIKTENQE
ncbi:MAG: hypothetical protein ACLFQK_06120 [Fibrobacterota bacterium]